MDDEAPAPVEKKKRRGRPMRRRAPGASRVTYRPTIREAVLANLAKPEGLRLSPAELASRLKVRIDSIYVCMSNLRTQGIVDPRPKVREEPLKGTPTAEAPPIIDPFPMVQRLLGHEVGSDRDIKRKKKKGIMAKAERATRLSEIGRFGAANSAVLAIQKLNEMEDRTGLNVGPGVPLTHEDKVARVQWVMLGAGKAVVKDALAGAFPEGLDVNSEIEDTADVAGDQGGGSGGTSDGTRTTDRAPDGGAQAQSSH